MYSDRVWVRVTLKANQCSIMREPSQCIKIGGPSQGIIIKGQRIKKGNVLRYGSVRVRKCIKTGN